MKSRERLNCRPHEGAEAGNELSDDAVIKRVLHEDMNAFEILMQRYDRWVRSIIARRVASHQVPDIVQEVFIQAYRSLPHYHLNTSFRCWLAMIALRRCYDYWRAEHRRPSCAVSNLSAMAAEQMEQLFQVMSYETAQSEMELARMREALGRAMDGLEADVQTILWLIYWENHSLEETAAILGDTPESVKMRASRARVQLRQLINSPPITEQPSMPVNIYQTEGMTVVS